MPSSLSASYGNLYDLLVPALAGLTPAVETVWGLPQTVESEPQEVVCLLGVEAPSEDAAALGNRRRSEEYSIIVAAKVYQPAGTARDVWTRMLVIVDTVRNTVLNNSNLNGAAGVLWAEPAEVRSDGTVPLQEGWIAFVEIPIRVHARI